MEDGNDGVAAFAFLLFLIGLYGTIMIWSDTSKGKEDDES